MKRHKGVMKLEPRKYQVRVRVTDPRTGERKEVRRVCNGTLADALDMQKQITEELGDDRKRSRLRLKEYVTTWLENRRATVKPSTARKYENDLNRHILPVLGGIYVDKLRPRDVAEFIADQSRKFSGWSVANRLRLLRTIAKDALADGLAEYDFCARVRPPKCRTYSAEDPNCLTAAQLDQLAQAIPVAWYPLFATMAFTGLRWGEASGLKWSDIDHESGIIRVMRNNWKGVVNEPKTEKSRRTVPMVGRLADILRAHRSRMLAAQHPGLAAGWVFPTERGTLHRGTPMGPVLRQALRKAGIDVHLTPHGLRRTFNDLARRVAASHVVRAIVGHTTDAMTCHYSVIDTEEKRAAQEAVLEMVNGQSGDGKPEATLWAKGAATEATEPADGDRTGGKKSLQGEDFGEDRVPGDPSQNQKPE